MTTLTEAIKGIIKAQGALLAGKFYKPNPFLSVEQIAEINKISTVDELTPKQLRKQVRKLEKFLRKERNRPYVPVDVTNFDIEANRSAMDPKFLAFYDSFASYEYKELTEEEMIQLRKNFHEIIEEAGREYQNHIINKKFTSGIKIGALIIIVLSIILSSLT